MKVRELKEYLNSLPPECDEFVVVFGETAFGEKLKRIQKLGKKIILNFF